MCSDWANTDATGATATHPPFIQPLHQPTTFGQLPMARAILGYYVIRLVAIHVPATALGERGCICSISIIA
jgi:hypothetical protein